MFDANAKLGHWPYRPVRDVAALLEAMDGLGIERAVVSSLSAVHFLNPQDGNEELARLVAPHRDRLVPFAVLRPNFAGWDQDLRLCVEDFGMRGVVVHPAYHEFALADPEMNDLAGAASASGLPLCIQTGLEDLRRQYRPYKTPEIAPVEAGAFARAHPNVTIIVLGLKFGQPQLLGEPWPDNVYFDTSNYEGLNELESAIERFSSGRILFGTNFPLFNPRANVDKLRTAVLDDTQKRRIASENLRGILRENVE